MPANNAFTGFTANGQNNGTMNIDGTDNWQTFKNNFGYNFWTSSSKTATIYFPASGYRNNDDGSLGNVGTHGRYWSAVPGNTSYGCNLSFGYYYNIGPGYLYPLYSNLRTCGLAVQAVEE